MAILTIRSVSELLSVVPFLIGFHPDDSLVVVATDGSMVMFAFRTDLPAVGADDLDALAPVLQLARLTIPHRPDEVILLGYGEGVRVTPALQRLSTVLTRAGITVVEELRITGGRYWSYTCDNLICCPAEGKLCPSPNSVLAAEATFAGAVALRNRKEFEAQLAPVTGEQRAAMAEAGARASSRLRALGGDTGRDRPERLVQRAGRAAVRSAEKCAGQGTGLTDDEVAWLVLLLQYGTVRDYAWMRIGTESRHVALWAEVVRRADPTYVAPAASLLAFAAWRAGEGPLASVAIERALAADPGYAMAMTMHGVLCAAVPPAAVDGWPAVPGVSEVFRAAARGTGPETPL
ncbi:DUF4192 domain-containing protein [Actinoplanes sp. N902-109]|uniref:DUF4192 domain-containing protein n=1 Tax=Actinoplanes sp. (strain N902-109) TaxID=649831 RepID=UPI0003296830|nr:DUF4192 domain-containing protein [Actinoplanes sp. N902-109]AGL21660.1 hypothetical protein L083_8150 [Actinoplanes sp. N902-109]